MLAVLEPATEAVLAEIPRAGVEETDAAVARAKAAYPGWKRVPPGDRARLLHGLADVLERDLERLAVPVREEIFGPVACVLPFGDEEEAIRLANDTIYGLSGSIWTRDGARALRVARAVEAGVLSINSNSSVRVATPFGGFKQSGVGRELGPHALDHYTEVKSVFYSTEES